MKGRGRGIVVDAAGSLGCRVDADRTVDGEQGGERVDDRRVLAQGGLVERRGAGEAHRAEGPVVVEEGGDGEVRAEELAGEGGDLAEDSGRCPVASQDAGKSAKNLVDTAVDALHDHASAPILGREAAHTPLRRGPHARF